MDINKCRTCRHYGEPQCRDAGKYEGFECVLYSASPNARDQANRASYDDESSYDAMSGWLRLALWTMVISAITSVAGLVDIYDEYIYVENFIAGNLPIIGFAISACILAVCTVAKFINRSPSAVYYGLAYSILVAVTAGAIGYMNDNMGTEYALFGSVTNLDIFVYTYGVIIIYLLISRNVSRVIPSRHRKFGFKDLVFILVLFALPLVPLYNRYKEIEAAQLENLLYELEHSDYYIGAQIVEEVDEEAVDEDTVSYDHDNQE